MGNTIFDSTKTKAEMSIENYDSDFFFVRLLQGNEHINRPYKFDIEFICPLEHNDNKLDLDEIFNSNVELKIGEYIYNSNFETLDFVDILPEPYEDYGLFKAKLVPNLYKLNFISGDIAYISFSASKLIRYLINENIPDYGVFRLNDESKYPEKAYFIQFEENKLDFLNRICEYWGIYYTFEFINDKERIVFNNSKTTLSIEDSPVIAFSKNLSETEEKEQILLFNEKVINIPSKIIIKGYDYQNEKVELTEEFKISDNLRGKTTVFSENILSEDEINLIGNIRKEAYLSMKNRFYAKSTAPTRPGETLKMTSHPIYEDKDLHIISIKHFLDQTSLLVSDLKSFFPDKDNPIYTNEFSAIDVNTQFRSINETDKPKILGHLIARITTGEKLKTNKPPKSDDKPNPAATTGGRYFINFNMPMIINEEAENFDEIVPIRQIKLHTGNSHGFTTPLQENDEVLVSFVNADLDLPVIIGSVPNSSVSNVRSIHKTLFKSKKGSEILFSDEEEKEGILLKTEPAETLISFGDAIELLEIEEIKEEFEKEEKIKKILQSLPAYIPRAIALKVDPQEVGLALSSEKELLLEADNMLQYINGDSIKFVEEVVQELIFLDYLRVTGGYYGELTTCELEMNLSLTQVIKAIWTRVRSIRNEYKAFKADVIIEEYEMNTIKDRIIAEAQQAIDNKLSSYNSTLEAYANKIAANETKIASILTETNNTLSEMTSEETGINAQITNLETAIQRIDTTASNIKTSVIESKQEEVSAQITEVLDRNGLLKNDANEIILQ